MLSEILTNAEHKLLYLYTLIRNIHEGQLRESGAYGNVSRYHWAHDTSSSANYGRLNIS